MLPKVGGNLRQGLGLSQLLVNQENAFSPEEAERLTAVGENDLFDFGKLFGTDKQIVQLHFLFLQILFDIFGRLAYNVGASRWWVGVGLFASCLGRLMQGAFLMR